MLDQQYRQFAKEALGWAQAAPTNAERAVYLDLAETWIAAAMAAERRANENAPRGQAWTRRGVQSCEDGD